jgi:hypothetical protein
MAVLDSIVFRMTECSQIMQSALSRDSLHAWLRMLQDRDVILIGEWIFPFRESYAGDTRVLGNGSSGLDTSTLMAPSASGRGMNMIGLALLTGNVCQQKGPIERHH